MGGGGGGGGGDEGGGAVAPVIVKIEIAFVVLRSRATLPWVYLVAIALDLFAPINLY